MGGGGNLQWGGHRGSTGPSSIHVKKRPSPVVPDPCKFELYQLHQILSSYSSVDYILIIKWIILNSACTCVRKTRNWKQGVRGGEGGGGCRSPNPGNISAKFRQSGIPVGQKLDDDRRLN